MNQRFVPPETQAIAQNLLTLIGQGQVSSIESLGGGRNNRVFRVVGHQGPVILKQYHQSEGTGRDRFASEVAWYRYCQAMKTNSVPRLWIADESSRCALFAEIPGRKLVAGEVTADHVRQAAEFVIEVNSDRSLALAANLPVAADACFCIEDFIKHVEIRLERLRNVPGTCPETHELRTWLTESLDPEWQRVKANIEKNFDQQQRQTARTQHERCVSPSDFGFHNAILTGNGQLSFLDFEYAGWDDPAKLVCDFYWQVEAPVPRETLPIMMAAVRSMDDGLEERVRRMFAAVGIKWCALVLNEFLHDGKARREFAATTSLHGSARSMQLGIAQQILNDVRTLDE